MNVIIRADGNREIAMGHMMRCLSIAEALRETGAQVCFVTAGDETRDLIASRGFAHIILQTSFRDMEGELSALHGIVNDRRAERILVDSYFVTERYMRELGAWAETAYLDDLGEPVYPVDTLINYNIYGAELPYEAWYQKAGIPLPKRMLLGCSYAPLRREFTGQAVRAPRDLVRDVLITTGGGDAANAAEALCGGILQEARQGMHAGIRYHVVCGPFSEQKERLRALAQAYPMFCIHENVTNMSELMHSCDIAVSAAGSTMYELCSMRIPAVCFYFAENQRRMAACFARTTEIQNAGNIMEARERVLDRLLTRLRELEQDGALRERIRRQMGMLTDGRGADRIANALTGQGTGYENETGKL